MFTRRTSTTEWSGLSFQNGSAGSLQHCTIEYATRYDGMGITAVSPSSMTLSNCIVRNNDYGFYGNPASPHIVNCQFINNNNYGIYLNGASVPTFGSNLAEWNDIYGNGGYNLYNGTENITAGYVYWGVLDSASIAATIYDRYDLATLGIVSFFPWTNAAHDQLYPGEFLPEPVVVIYTDCDEVSCDHIYLVWDPVPGATAYRVYSSDNPDTGFLEDLTGTYLGSSWVAPFPEEDRFYYVIARN